MGLGYCVHGGPTKKGGGGGGGGEGGAYVVLCVDVVLVVNVEVDDVEMVLVDDDVLLVGYTAHGAKDTYFDTAVAIFVTCGAWHISLYMWLLSLASIFCSGVILRFPTSTATRVTCHTIISHNSISVSYISNILRFLYGGTHTGNRRYLIKG